MLSNFWSNFLCSSTNKKWYIGIQKTNILNRDWHLKVICDVIFIFTNQQLISFSVFHCWALPDMCAGQLSSWIIQGLSGKCFKTTGHRFWSFDNSMYLSVFKFISIGLSTPTPETQTYKCTPKTTPNYRDVQSWSPNPRDAISHRLFSTLILFVQYLKLVVSHQRILQCSNFQKLSNNCLYRHQRLTYRPPGITLKM